MAQWPEGGKHLILSLSKLWTNVAHPMRIVDICSNGLLPIPQAGLTTFFIPSNKQPTELTCSLKYKPGGMLIDGYRLVALALTCLFLKSVPIEAISFCKARWEVHTESDFWNAVKLYLEHSITMPPSIREAIKIENPTVRNFVLACWHRLSLRFPLNYLEEFLTKVTCEQWNENSKVWGGDVCKHMNLIQTPFVITTMDKADFMIEGVAIKVPKRDKIVLLLLMMFAKRDDKKSPWGEKLPSSHATPLNNLFLEFDEIYQPKHCWVHECVAAAIDLNARYQEIAGRA